MRLRVPIAVAALALVALGAASPLRAACGDRLLTPDETCDSCPADCTPGAACAPGQPRRATVQLTPQSGYEKVGAVTVLLAYRGGVLDLPGERDAPEVAARVKARQPGAQVFVNDLGYGLRVAVTSGDGLPAGALLDVELTACQGAPAPQAADLSCRVESCAQGGKRLRLCTCAVALP
jgi:hypothetical protein